MLLIDCPFSFYTLYLTLSELFAALMYFGIITKTCQFNMDMTLYLHCNKLEVFLLTFTQILSTYSIVDSLKNWLLFVSTAGTYLLLLRFVESN